MRPFMLIAASALALAPGLAEAAEAPCLTPGEFTALAGYAMPSIISGTSQRCASTLAPNAYLRTSGKALSTRYAKGKAGMWTGAKAAFIKLSAALNPEANKLLRDMPDTLLQQMLDAMMEGMVGQQIPLERCASIDRLVRLLAPLPPENTAELIAVAVGLGSKSGGGKVGKIGLCPA